MVARSPGRQMEGLGEGSRLVQRVREEPCFPPELVWRQPKPVRLQQRNTLLRILCLRARDQLRVDPSQ